MRIKPCRPSGYPLHHLSMPIRLPGDSTHGEGVRTAAEKRYWVLITPDNSDNHCYLSYGLFGDAKRRESDHSAAKIGPTRMLACIYTCRYYRQGPRLALPSFCFCRHRWDVPSTDVSNFQFVTSGSLPRLQHAHGYRRGHAWFGGATLT